MSASVTMKSLLSLLWGVFVVVVWMGCSVSASTSTTTTTTSTTSSLLAKVPFRVRSVAGIQLDGQDGGGRRHRDLLDFIPTFSDDGLDAQLPVLTLELVGTSGQALSDDAYDAIQYAMSDYLRDTLKQKWPSTSTSDYDAGTVGDAVNGRVSNVDTTSSRTPALTTVRTEVVADRPLEEDDNRRRRRRGLQQQITGNEIDLKTTLTFRDLAQQDGATAQVPTGGGEDIDYNEAEQQSSSSSSSSSSVPSEDVLMATAGDVWNDLSVFTMDYLYVAIGNQGTTVQEEFLNLESVHSKEAFPTSSPTAAPTPLSEGTSSTSSGTDGSGTDSTTGTSVSQVNDSSNLVAQPKYAMNPLWPALIVGISVFLCTILVLGYRRRRSSDLIGNKDESSIVHVHRSFTEGGDEEIEVGEPAWMEEGSSDRHKKKKSKGGGGLCGGRSPATHQTLDSTFDESFEEEENHHHHHHLQVADSEEDLRPPSIANVPREDMDLYADLTPEEKQRFLRYMHSGMSIEEASRRVLEERQTSSGVRNLSRSAKKRLQSEMMADGQTMVHVPEDLNSAGHSRRFGQPMVLSEASSVESSFDDREYLRVGEETTASALDLGKAASRKGAGSGAYSESSPSSLGHTLDASRGERTPGTAMGQGILCYPESAV